MSKDGNRFLKGFFTAGAEGLRAKADAQARQDEIRAQGAESWKRTVYEVERRAEEQAKEREKDLEVAKIMAGKAQRERFEYLNALTNGINGLQAPQPTPTPSPSPAPQDTPNTPPKVYKDKITLDTPSGTEGANPTQDLANEVGIPPTSMPSELPPPQASIHDKIQAKAREIQSGNPVIDSLKKEKQLANTFVTVDPEKFAPKSLETDTKIAKEEQESAKDKRNIGMEVVKDFNSAFNDKDATPFISSDLSQSERTLTAPLQDPKVNERIKGKLTSIVRSAIDGEGQVLSGAEYKNYLSSLLQDRIVLTVKDITGQDVSELESRYQGNLDKFQGITGISDEDRDKIDNALLGISTKDAITKTKSKAAPKTEVAPKEKEALINVNSKEAYDALPSGSVFISNGKKFKKP